jgi:hypothetical protein
MRSALGLRPAFALALVPVLLTMQDSGNTPPPSPPTLLATPTFIDDDVFLEVSVEDYVPNGAALLKASVYADQWVSGDPWPTTGSPPVLEQLVATVPFPGMPWTIAVTDQDNFDPALAGSYYWVWVKLSFGNQRGALYTHDYVGSWDPADPGPIELEEADTIQLASMIDFGQRGGMIVSVEYLGGSAEGYDIETISVFADSLTAKAHAMPTAAPTGTTLTAPTPVLSTAGTKRFDLNPFAESPTQAVKVGKVYVDLPADNNVIWVLADVQLTKPVLDANGAPALDPLTNRPILDRHHKRFRTLITGSRPTGPELMWDLDQHGPPPKLPPSIP